MAEPGAPRPARSACHGGDYCFTSAAFPTTPRSLVQGGVGYSRSSVKRLPARLCERPRILFVGINPSLRSAEVGHHFAGPGTPFWRLLHAAQLVPEPLTYEDDVRLPQWGLALTNIVPRATREASELSRAEFEAGRVALARLIARVEPEVVAFVGTTVYRAFFGSDASGGAGPKPERIGDARVFVLPNPSGRNANFTYAEMLAAFRKLRRRLDRWQD